MHRECTCPNCCRTFHAASISAVAEYCPECWEAWISAAGRFEKRTDRYKKQGD